MYHHLSGDWAAIDDVLAAALNQSLQFLRSLDQRPAGVALPHVVAAGGELDFEAGQGAAASLHEAVRRFNGIIGASSSPRYLGYVTGGVTPAALLGDWLASVYDQNPQGLKAFGDASARIEFEAVRLLLDFFDLPDDFNGGFVTGATLSGFTCLGVARQWVGQRQGYNIAAEGIRRPIRVLTATPHSSAVKSLTMLGLGSASVVPVATLPGREAMDVADLERQAVALNGEPFIIIASGGTVNTVDFDDFTAILKLKDRYDFWLHIDAAFGGFAARSQVHRKLLKRWEEADSITVDNHKWLNVPYDSGTWLIRKTHQKLQVETFQNGQAAYLNLDATDFTYLNLGPENSRRLRALPVWMTLRAYGKAGYDDIVGRAIDTAQALGRAIEASAEYRLLAPVHLNVVAFTLNGRTEAEINRFVQFLNDDGRYFMTPTTLWGQRGIRAAFVNWRHSADQVPPMITALNAALQQL